MCCRTVPVSACKHPRLFAFCNRFQYRDSSLRFGSTSHLPKISPHASSTHCHPLRPAADRHRATLLPATGVAADKTDVTTKVVAAVSDNKLTISATNETFGDTIPGVPKKLRVETASVTGKR